VNKRILYADNDRNYLDARCEFLELEGYEVRKACSPKEAEQILEQENIHLAILDIRLTDDNDEGDISGILLAKDVRFKRVPKIFITGFPTFEAVREAYGPVIGKEPIAYAFLAKKEGPEVMIEAVNSTFEEVVRINWELSIAWDAKGMLSFPYLAMLLEGSEDTGRLTQRSGELADLFGKLFIGEQQIAIARLNWLGSGCICLSLYSFSEGATRQSIVIGGLWDAVSQQYERVEWYLTLESGVLPKPAYADSIHYAAFAYDFPDAGSGLFQTGAVFFNESGDKVGQKALEHLFRQTLHKWHLNQRKESGGIDLAAAFNERLGMLGQNDAAQEIFEKVKTITSRAKRYQIIKEFTWLEQEIEIKFPNNQIYLGPDPITCLRDANAFQKQAAVITSTFGGISGSSLLIDQNGRVFPTDMASTTQSPLLEDFVSLECEFHFDHIKSSNLLTLWDFEKKLGKAQNLNSIFVVKDVEPECRKSMTMIQTIRMLAAEKNGPNLEPYLIGLFHYVVHGLLHYDPQRYLPKREIAQLVHRLLVASMLVSQIDNLRRGAAAPNPNAARRSGVQINESSREVWVDDRELHLTQTEFKLLLCLFHNPNQLCSREDLLIKVFEIKETPTKSYKGLVNTHMDRLRKKVDINPTEHRYIVTIRGEGYKLDLKR
jgi:DNA-binding response OmpR family regulator